MTGVDSTSLDLCNQAPGAGSLGARWGTLPVCVAVGGEAERCRSSWQQYNRKTGGALWWDYSNYSRLLIISPKSVSCGRVFVRGPNQWSMQILKHDPLKKTMSNVLALIFTNWEIERTVKYVSNIPPSKNTNYIFLCFR